MDAVYKAKWETGPLGVRQQSGLVVKNTNCGLREVVQIQIPTPALRSCADLSKGLDFSDPQDLTS